MICSYRWSIALLIVTGMSKTTTINEHIVLLHELYLYNSTTLAHYVPSCAHIPATSSVSLRPLSTALARVSNCAPFMRLSFKSSSSCSAFRSLSFTYLLTFSAATTEGSVMRSAHRLSVSAALAVNTRRFLDFVLPVLLICWSKFGSRDRHRPIRG